MTATILDVAAAAGVSTASVSRFLRGDPVRAADAIRGAIARLRYRPAAAARALRSGVHHAIAMVVPDVTNPYFAAVAKGVEAVFRPTPYRVFLSNTDEQSLIEDEVLDDVAPRVDGIILAPAVENEDAPRLIRQSRLPIVLVDRDTADHSIDCVLVDNAGGAALAAEHLHALGHRRIALVGGPVSNTPGRTRRDGFLAALAARGCPPGPDHVVLADFRESGGYAATARLLALAEPPTAIFSANNAMTVGALKALAAAGLRPGRDVSLVGFDDLDLASLLDPPLTVVERAADEQGAAAARLLLRRLAAPPERDDEAERIVLPTRLVVRGSTQPPPLAGRGAGRAAR